MKINIYTIPECPFCTKLKGLLDETNIKYDELNVYDDENEQLFDSLVELSGSESVPMITIGKHLLAPDVNFKSIEEAVKLIKHILKNESDN